MSTLRRYVRHAEQYGVDGVFEAAIGDLDADQLAALELRLRELDPKWRPPRDRRDVLEVANHGSKSQQTGGLSITNRATPGECLTTAVSATRCAVCEERLRPERSTARYCSRKCQQRAYRGRLAA